MKNRCFNILLCLVVLLSFSNCDSDEEVGGETETNLVSKITDGYVLYSHIGDTTTHLIDSLGVGVKTWSSTYTSSGGSYLSSDKTLLRLGKSPLVNSGSFSDGGLVAGVIEELDDNSDVIWSIEKTSDEATFHHDFKEIDANTIIALTWELRIYNNSEYWNEVVIIIDKLDNSTLWEWSAIDDGAIFPVNTNKTDYLHFNSVDYKEGNILISSRGQNTLYVINKESKMITQSLTASETLSGQHDATFLDNGNILVFNNVADTNTSAVLELSLLDEVVWSYSNNFYSDHISGAQRLASGNTLICSGTESRFIEVTEEGEEVWDYTSVNTSSSKSSEIFKVHKYSDY
jgi:hypothetical protein